MHYIVLEFSTCRADLKIGKDDAMPLKVTTGWKQTDRVVLFSQHVKIHLIAHENSF